MIKVSALLIRSIINKKKALHKNEGLSSIKPLIEIFLMLFKAAIFSLY
ncbi:MAG: hypothetical protein RJA07_2011 [Bacteroidota bacterium]|jgi:hypothetical protein